MDTHLEGMLALDVPRFEVSGRIRSLVAAAAHSADCQGAVLILLEGGKLEVVARHGRAADLFEPTEKMLENMLPGSLHVQRNKRRVAHKITGIDQADLRFIASVSIDVDNETVGFLAACDTEPHTFSAAQEYVLRTLAAEIGDQMKLQRLLRSERAIRTSNDVASERLRLLESVVVNANDAVLITEAEPLDLPGPKILYANAAFTRTTGYTLAEILGKTPRILHGPDTNRKPLERLKVALREWKPVEVELLNYRKDGSTFWVELSIVPVANETGWFTHWVSVQRDVSERKANEENAVRIRMAEAHNEALANEVKERMRSEAQLAHTAFHDHLTGLRNRAYFMDRLAGSVEQFKGRLGSTCAVVFLDIDNFKTVNDRFGHSVGDLLLVEIAERLKACTRTRDTVARIGGDEFTIFLEDLHEPREAILLVERILEALRAPMHLVNNEVISGASAGISIGHYTDPEHILRDADTAMYRAKEEGGNRYAVFNEAMHEEAMAALNVRLELGKAIEQGQFELHYQPLVDTKTQQICALEALVRWRHPQRGIVPPLDFIEIAEKTGLIVPLGSWILKQACRHLCILKKSVPALQNFRMSVNVSTRQFDDPSFFSDLESALAESGIKPSELQLEITESVFVNNPERIGKLFRRIRKLGVQIACDDFGTGYSSLSYLQMYPIDTIKIDQSFVKRLDTKQADADIVHMIVSLAQALRMNVTAEGVESIGQQDVLREYGCTVVQGYLYSPPITFEEMTSLLIEQNMRFPFESQSRLKSTIVLEHTQRKSPRSHGRQVRCFLHG